MEEWRPVVGYEGRYEISSEGRVRAWIPRYRERPPVTPRILCPNHGIAGRYDGVTVCDGHGGQRKRTIHQLVAEAFCGARPPGAEVRHLDGNPTNNHADNLAWGTRLENMADAKRHGTMQHGADRHNARLTDLDVVHVRQLSDAGLGRRELSLMYGVSCACIGHVVRRDHWKHVA